MSQKERKAPRALVNIPLKFVFENQNKVTGVIKDISVTGIQSSKLDESLKLRSIEFELAGSHTLKIEVKVIWSQDSRAGLRFKNISARDVYIIKNIVRFHRE